MQYVVSCLRFLFNAKMYLFISRCRRHTRVKISQAITGSLAQQPCNNTVKVRITSMGILNICNLWILLRKIVIYCRTKMSSSWTFSLLKLTEVMS